jgi:hypothetical protein
MLAISWMDLWFNFMNIFHHWIATALYYSNLLQC